MVSGGKLSSYSDKFIVELRRTDRLFVPCELENEKPKPEPEIHYWI